MKKSLIILLSLFLVACGIIIAETPEEALEKFNYLKKILLKSLKF